MFCFIHYWKKKLKLDWLQISADRKTYLMSQIASLYSRQTVFLKFIFIYKCYLSFILHFFQKLTYVKTSFLGYCAFSNIRTAVKLFAAVLQIKEAKIIVVEDSGHKCVCNNSTLESENLKDLFCKSYILRSQSTLSRKIKIH